MNQVISPNHKNNSLTTPNISELESRVRTFYNWPNTQVSKRKLASAGFTYTGKDDTVVCPLCNLEGFDWTSEDDPLADHRDLSPDCPFFRTPERSYLPKGRISGFCEIEILSNSLPEDTRFIDVRQLGCYKQSRPHNEDKITFENRLATFVNWPKSIKQKPADLAEAGFYYTGVGDRTLCFCCGGGLKNWNETDDPWERHVLWFGKCPFLKFKKDNDFVEKVKHKTHSLLTLFDVEDDQTKELECVKEPSSSTLERSKRVAEKQAKDKSWCKICLKNEVGVVFLPCEHVVACVDCASILKNCAMCKKLLEAAVSVGFYDFSLC